VNLPACYDFVFRYQWLLLGSLVVGLGAATAGYFESPPRFRSEAKLLVRYVSDSLIIDPEVAGKRLEKPGSHGEMVIITEKEILTSPGLMASAVAAQVEQNRVAAPGAEATPALSMPEFNQHYGVQTAPDSSTIQLTYDGRSPQQAQQALRCLIAAYLLKHQEVHQDPGAYAFISQQTDEMQTQLTDTEEKLRVLKQELGVASLTEAQAANVLRERELAREVSHAESTQAAALARLRTLETAMGRRPRAATAMVTGTATGSATATATPVLAAPTRSDGYGQLQRLRQTEETLLATYTATSIPVQGIRSRIAELEAQLTRVPLDSVNAEPVSLTPVVGAMPAEDPVAQYLALQADAAALTAELSVLRVQQKTARAEGRQLEVSEAPISHLERAKDLYETNYRYFSERLEKERINVALEASKISNIVLIQTPTLPLRARYSDVLQRLLLILAACLATGVAVALAREHVLDHAFRHPGEVPRMLGVPLLVTLPKLQQAPDSASVNSAKGRLDAGDGLPRWMAGCEVVAQLIRQWAKEVEGPLLVGFTAPNGASGVSSIARQVAQALQQSDMPRVNLATVLGSGHLVYPAAEAEPVEAMVEPAVATDSPPAHSGPWLPMRTVPSHESPTTPAVIAELTEREYDCVLLDLPPPDQAQASVRLLPNLHGVIVVLDHGRSTHAQARACLDMLRQLRCRVLGGVLNRYSTPIPAWLCASASSPFPTPAHAPQRPPAGNVRNAMGDPIPDTELDLQAVRVD